MRRNSKTDWLFIAATLAAAYGLKSHYSTATPDGLRWILQPTSALVELVTGTGFAYEAGIGWTSYATNFVIGKPCAGVNFLIVAWVAVVVGFVASRRTALGKAGLVVGGLVAAYAAALVANVVRISVALWLHTDVGEIGPLDRGEVHRVEGVVVYLAFLCLFYAAARKVVKA